MELAEASKHRGKGKNRRLYAVAEACALCLGVDDQCEVDRGLVAGVVVSSKCTAPRDAPCFGGSEASLESDGCISGSIASSTWQVHARAGLVMLWSAVLTGALGEGSASSLSADSLGLVPVRVMSASGREHMLAV